MTSLAAVWPIALLLTAACGVPSAGQRRPATWPSATQSLPSPQQLREQVNMRGLAIVALIDGQWASPDAQPVRESGTCTAPAPDTGDEYCGHGYEVVGQWHVRPPVGDHWARLTKVYQAWKKVAAYHVGSVRPDGVTAWDSDTGLSMSVSVPAQTPDMAQIMVFTGCYRLPRGG